MPYSYSNLSISASGPTHGSEVAVSFDGHSQLPVVTGLAVYDGSEVFDEALENGCVCLTVLWSFLHNVYRDLCR